MATPRTLTQSLSLWRRLRADIAFASVGALVGAVSLTYPFCRDQTLFAYVGRAWFHEGQVPYRDTFEQKTPFIFLVHGALTSFSANDVLALRVLEVALVLAAGWFATLASRSVGTPSAKGVTGITVLVAAIFYFTSLRFPDTGSCEVWGVVALLGSRAVMARWAHRWGAAGGGLLSGSRSLRGGTASHSPRWPSPSSGSGPSSVSFRTTTCRCWSDSRSRWPG